MCCIIKFASPDHIASDIASIKICPLTSMTAHAILLIVTKWCTTKLLTYFGLCKNAKVNKRQRYTDNYDIVFIKERERLFQTFRSVAIQL